MTASAATTGSIVERIVGETGEPGEIVEAARALSARVLPALAEALAQAIAPQLGLELEAVAVARIAEARPDGEGFALAIAASEASPDALILTLDPAACGLLVALLFGSDADAPAAAMERDLSPTETDICSLAFEAIAAALNGSGERALALQLPVPPAIAGQELRKLALRDGPGVRITFSLGTQASRGRLALTMPQRLLVKYRTAGAEHLPPATWTERIGAEVRRTDVTVRATMPLARMTLSQLAALEPGQLIAFQDDASSQVRLSARQKTLFVCDFGKLGSNYTVRVRHPFENGSALLQALPHG
ncbi:MAG: FliM/FliN family flagellar motor switch protein [Rhizobiaceae bacterium]